MSVLNFVRPPSCLAERQFRARAVRRSGSKERQYKVRWRSWTRAGRHEVAYLRAAQAYMLISMPTRASTIFGCPRRVVTDRARRRRGGRLPKVASLLTRRRLAFDECCHNILLS